MNPFIYFSCLNIYISYGLRVPFKLLVPKSQVDHIYNFFCNLTVYTEVNILRSLWPKKKKKNEDQRYNFTTVEFIYLFQIFFTKRFPKFEIHILDKLFNS